MPIEKQYSWEAAREALYQRYAERLCICIAEGRKSEEDAESMARVECTSLMLKIGMDSTARNVEVKKFKRRAREEGLIK